MKKLILLTLSAMSLAVLTGCNAADNSPNYKAGDKIYTSRIIFDASAETPENVHFDLGKDVGGVKSVKAGRNEIKFGFHNGVLTLDGESLKEVGAKETQLTVTLSNDKTKKVDALLATKIIKTVDDYKHINDSAKSLQGIYVLGNDIDFNNQNVEPLGNFTDEEDPNKAYFHGVFDGDGYSLKNMSVSYSDGATGTSDSGYPSNYDVYSGQGKFIIEGHDQGDNIGVFQYIGDAGVVRNTVFDNVYVHGRTIVGIIAGNCAGEINNCLIKENCTALMDTHFWDDDCNVGGAVGIVGGSGKVSNTICLTTRVSVRPTYEDYGDKYIGEPGTGYDHGGNTQNNFWRFWGENKVDSNSNPVKDSNNNATNGVYAFVGKCWGMVEYSVGALFTARRYTAAQNDEALFGQTHLGANKPSSGEGNMGSISMCRTYNTTDMKVADHYDDFDANIWNIVDGQYPALKTNVNAYRIAE